MNFTRMPALLRRFAQYAVLIVITIGPVSGGAKGVAAQKGSFSTINSYSTTALPALRVMADQLGLTIGVELDGGLMSNTTYQQILDREFNLVTVDGGIYWIDSEPQKGRIALTWPDQQMQFVATRNNMAVRGHPLAWVDSPNAWDSSIPDWLKNGNFSRDEWIGILRNHVSQVAEHYRGRMNEWVVVNEADERGNLQNRIGTDYIEMAFQAAREADPNATLIYNNYGNEQPYAGYSGGFQTPLTQDVVNRLKSKGLIDGVGLQMHFFNANYVPTKEQMIAAMQSYGVPVYITECDVDLTYTSGTQSERFAYQAQIYGRITDACLESGVCKSLTFWGIGDKYSWLETYMGEPNADATLYNDNLQPKPAYYAVQQSLYSHLPARALAAASTALLTDEPQTVSGEVEAGPSEVTDQGISSWVCDSDEAYPCNSTLNAVKMASSSDGWAVGDAGLILHWDGFGWSRVQSGTTADLRSLSVVSATDAWAVGTAGTILHWTGSAWSPVASPSARDLRSVAMVSATDGWIAVRAGGGANECTDYLQWNGTAWVVPVHEGCSGYIRAIAARSSTELFSVGDYGYMGSYAAGSPYGWGGNYIDTYKSFRSAALSADDGWAVGTLGGIARLIANSWVDQPSPTTAELFGVAIVSGADAWAVGENGTILRWDGASWQISTSPTSYDLKAITMLSATEGWAVGESTILRWDGSTWSLLKNISPTIQDLTSVALTSPSEGWAVGQGGKLVQWSGGAWLQATSPVTSAMNSVALASTSNGWAAGAGGVLLRWNGSAWSKASSPTNRTLNSVAADPSGKYWAVGRGGTILRWSGSAWSKVASPTTKDLGSVAAVSANDAWAVGSGGWGYGSVILHWNGTKWSLVASPTGNSLASVSMLTGKNGWAVGQAGTIIHWNGTTWAVVSSPTTQRLLAVKMLAASDGWAVGANGTVLHWNGTAWSKMTGASVRLLNGIARASASTNEAWIVGAGGTILHYAGSPAESATLSSESGNDGWILETAETSNIGGTKNASGATIRLGDDAANKQYRGILSFNTSSLPPGAVITHMTLKLKKAGQTGAADPFAVLGNILVDVKKGSFGAAALESADFQSAASGSAALTIKNNPLAEGWYYGELGANADTFINRAGKTQFRLGFKTDDNNNRLANYLTFHSGNALAPEIWPVLVIDYYVP